MKTDFLNGKNIIYLNIILSQIKKYIFKGKHNENRDASKIILEFVNINMNTNSSTENGKWCQQWGKHISKSTCIMEAQKAQTLEAWNIYEERTLVWEHENRIIVWKFIEVRSQDPKKTRDWFVL